MIEAWLQQMLNQIGGSITAAPTPKSLRDILHKDGNFTYDHTTDSLEAIREKLDGLSLLTAKEKAFMGGPGPVPLREYFNTLGAGTIYSTPDPDASVWTILKGTGASLGIVFVDPIAGGYICPPALIIDSGATSGSSSSVHTTGKRFWCVGHPGVTTIHLKTKVWVNLLTGQGAIGFIQNSATNGTSVQFADSGNFGLAGIFFNNNIVKFHTTVPAPGNNYAYQNTIVTDYFAADSYREVEIVCSGTESKLYVDGTLRATQSHAQDAYPLMSPGSACFSVTNENAARTRMRINYVEVWHE